MMDHNISDENNELHHLNTQCKNIRYENIPNESEYVVRSISMVDRRTPPNLLYAAMRRRRLLIRRLVRRMEY